MAAGVVLFATAQVIVTTSSIAGQCKPDLQKAFARCCPYLFIDEAHHAEAHTCSEFKRTFNARRIVQFTATPFREDGKPLDGTIIFKYPLKRAREEGYFKPIRFERIVCQERPSTPGLKSALGSPPCVALLDCAYRRRSLPDKNEPDERHGKGEKNECDQSTESLRFPEKSRRPMISTPSLASAPKVAVHVIFIHTDRLETP